ncbi:MAG: AAA family ATPase, partial [Anaerolineales bacterium]|nr:AAA family ATPase [Anaerolineales bacterium]
MIAELPAERLRRTCEPDILGCRSSEDVPPLERIVGQERAVRALRFGLSIKELGFNIYVAGPPGTGKTTAVERFIEDVASAKPVPPDWCYVNDFHAPHQPRALSLPPGRATVLQRDMRTLVESAKREVRAAFESDEYVAKREEVVKGFQDRSEQLV